MKYFDSRDEFYWFVWGLIGLTILLLVALATTTVSINLDRENSKVYPVEKGTNIEFDNL